MPAASTKTRSIILLLCSQQCLKVDYATAADAAHPAPKLRCCSSAWSSCKSIVVK
jgi:hypothetical protein